MEEFSCTTKMIMKDVNELQVGQSLVYDASVLDRIPCLIHDGRHIESFERLRRLLPRGIYMHASGGTLVITKRAEVDSYPVLTEPDE